MAETHMLSAVQPLEGVAGPLTNRLSYGWLDIDLGARTVAAHGCPIGLTTKEFDLLAFLAARPRCVFSREQLLQAVWQSTSAWQRPTTVTEHVRRVRSKLGDAPFGEVLVTVRSMGYRFDEPSPVSSGRVQAASRAVRHASRTLLYVEGRIVVADAHIRSLLGIEMGEELVGGRVLDRGSTGEV